MSKTKCLNCWGRIMKGRKTRPEERSPAQRFCSKECRDSYMDKRQEEAEWNALHSLYKSEDPK